MNPILSCTIIEDEPLAQELLVKYINRVSSLELAGTFDNAITAFDQLYALRPDIIFLDINMPEMTGIEFLKACPAPHPAVILTTANPNHAIDGFDLGVTDYLLKPFTFDRFLKAIGRVKEKTKSPSIVSFPAKDSAPLYSPGTPVSLTPDFCFLKTDKKLEQVRFDDIIFAEALGDYIKVHLPGQLLVTHLTMKKMEELLPSDRFLRTNRSYIVHLKKVKTLIGNTIVMTSGQELVIGPNYRTDVKKALQRWLAE